jgi:phosphatidylglycerophosphate synthase
MGAKERARAVMMPLAIDINPNLITALAVAAMGGAGWALLQGRPMIAVLLALLSGLLDLYDGAVAARHDRRTDFGAHLDKLADRISDAILIISAAYASGAGMLLGGAALAVALIPSYQFAVLESQTREVIAVKHSWSRALKLGILIAGIAVGQIHAALALLVVYGTLSMVDRILLAMRMLR